MTNLTHGRNHSAIWPSQHYQPQDESLDLQRYVRLGVKDFTHHEGAGPQDQGLAASEIAGLIEEVIFSHDTDRYFLISWTIMPNALLAIVELNSVYLVRHIVDAWKSAILRLIREHDIAYVPLWRSGYVIEHCAEQPEGASCHRRIAQAPRAAGLVDNAGKYYWSSNRYRTVR